MFSERLDFLMRVTDTSNSVLARAISFDPSYISKIRTGKRKLPRNEDFFVRAVPYFVRNLSSDYQRKAVSDVVLGGRSLPESRAALEKLLSEWLRGEEKSGNEVQRLLYGASKLTPEAFAPASHGGSEIPERAAPAATPAMVFYGNEGKRRAVELFLSRLCAAGKPVALLLYSDEDMAWMYEDAAFINRWGALLSRLLALGSSVKMIHTLSRNASELMAAVKGWLPLYLTGRVEPFYCPRLRDGIYRRSLFVAQGHAALVSTSVMTNTADMASLLFEDPETTGAFEAEFWNFLALCRPLMRIYRGGGDAEALRSEARRIDCSTGGLYLAQSLPSFATMPRSVLAEMAGDSAENLERIRARSAAALRARLDSGAQMVELLHLPDPKEIGSPALPLWQILGFPKLAYREELLEKHLSAALRLMERYENYRVVLMDEIAPELMVMASESAGAMLLCPLPAVFSMEEQNITSALLEYLQRLAERKRRRSDAHSLAEYIRALRKTK